MSKAASYKPTIRPGTPENIGIEPNPNKDLLLMKIKLTNEPRKSLITLKQPKDLRLSTAARHGSRTLQTTPSPSPLSRRIPNPNRPPAGQKKSRNEPNPRWWR